MRGPLLLSILIFDAGDPVGIASATVEIPTVTWPQVAYVIVTLLLVPIGTQVLFHWQNTKKLNTVKDSTAEVVHEVKPNSGSSMADTINATASAVGELKGDVSQVKTDVADVKTDVADVKTDVGELSNTLAAHLTEAAPLNDYVRQLKEREEYERNYRPWRWRRD